MTGRLVPAGDKGKVRKGDGRAAIGDVTADYVTVFIGDQLLGLRNGDSCEQVREDRAERAAKPYVKEVRQVGIPDVVVIGWVCRDEVAGCESL